jgi:hypothetical protein|tara:strand:+ start:1387 stop:1701 length:315 start_codon:yes stop_codon:yes gene_type:complete
MRGKTMQQSLELKNAIDAMRQIKTQADLSVLADIWRQQQTFIGNMAKSGLKKGDTIEWEYRGMVRTGIIQKMNRKTVEVADAGASPFGRTITKIQNSMITRKVA